MRAQIEKILNQSKKLQAIINVDDKQERTNVIDFLNGLSSDVLTKFQKRFDANDAEKINKIRLLVVNHLLEHQTITEEIIEGIKLEVVKNYDTNILQAWKSYFSLFLPLLYTEKLDSEINSIAKDVILKTGLNSHVSYKMVDFDGANNFGSGVAWIAIYNKKQPSQSASLQLFIGFSNDQLTYGLRRHSTKETQQLKQISFASFKYEEMIADLKSNAQAIIDDSQHVKCWKFSPGEGAKFWDVMEREGVAAIGWGNHSFSGKNRAQLENLLPNIKSKSIGIIKSFNDAKVGDKIVAFKGRQSVIGYGEITQVGLYSNQEIIPESDYHNFHKVKWVRMKTPIDVEKVAMDTFADISSKWNELSMRLSPMQPAIQDESYEKPAMSDMSLNQIFYGPPGTGKTFNTVKAALQILENTTNPLGEFKEQKARFDKFKSEGRIEFVTFHQSFSYEDFVEGIRANADSEQIKYSVQPGVFKKIAEKAGGDRNQPYVLIIDEINRGNTSKIFGDLITLIEKTKRAGEDEAVELTLPYSGKTFSVPNNLYIIGTMNTADRSLALIDNALRRRFDFIEMIPRADLIKVSDIDGVDIKKLLTKINERIEALYDREHTIGHAFFMKLTEKSKVDDLAKIFKNNILPLLEEYFFEDWEKISQVLSKSAIYEEHKFSNLDPDFDSLGKIYRRDDAKLKYPSTYQAIYSNASVNE